MNKRSLAIGSIVFASLSVSAFAAAPSAPADVVDISIGTDLVVDPGFGDMGYTIVNYNNGTDTWDEVVRLLPADGGGYWMTGFHKLDATGDQLAISKLDADGRLDLTF